MSLTIFTVDVLRLRGSKQSDELDDASFTWTIDVVDTLISPQGGEGDTAKARPLHARLAADGPDAWGDIDVSALVFGADEMSAAEARDALQGSPALEVLYDFARTHLQSVLGSVRADFLIPASSPRIELGVMEMSTPEDEP